MKTQTAQKQLSVLGIAALLLLALGCGRSNTVYSDPTDPTISIGRPSLPVYIYDESVNAGSVVEALDGVTSSSIALLMQTRPATSNASGGFNGNGQGNRALMGVSRFSGNALSSIGAITFDALYQTGSQGIDVNLLADLHCDGTSVRVLIASAAALAPGSAQSNGYIRFDADFSLPVWQVSGSSIKDPSNTTILVYSSSGATVTSLAGLLANYPNACLRNAASGDAALPNGTPTASILLSLGTPSTIDENSTFVNHMVIGTTEFTNMSWAN